MGFNSGFKGLICDLPLDTYLVDPAHEMYQYSVLAH